MSLWGRLSQRWRNTLTVLGIAAGFLACSFFDQTVELAKQAWDFLGGEKEQVLTLGTLILAAATYGLFKRTSDLAAETHFLAQQTADAGLLADMHHQQSLSGQLVVNGLDFGQISGPTMLGSHEPNRPTIVLKGSLRNVGFGPALKVRLALSHQGIGFDAEVRLDTLVPNQDIELDGKRKLGSFTWDQEPYTFLSTEMSGTFAPDALFDGTTLRVEWVNVFGGQTSSVYTAVNGAFFEKLLPLDVVLRSLPRAPLG